MAGLLLVYVSKLLGTTNNADLVHKNEKLVTNFCCQVAALLQVYVLKLLDTTNKADLVNKYDNQLPVSTAGW